MNRPRSFHDCTGGYKSVGWRIVRAESDDLDPVFLSHSDPPAWNDERGNRGTILSFASQADGEAAAESIFGHNHGHDVREYFQTSMDSEIEL